MCIRDRNDIDATTTTWDFNVAGLEETVPFDFQSIPNGPLVSVIGDFDGFINSDPSQYGVRHAPQTGTTTGLAIAAQDPRIMTRVGNDMYYTTNSGSSWAKSPVLNGAKGYVALSADGFALLHSPADSAVSYRSTNFGASWAAITGLTASNTRPVADPVNPSKFYVYDNGKLLASVDGGASFALKSTLASGGSKLIRPAPASVERIMPCTLPTVP